MLTILLIIVVIIVLTGGFTGVGGPVALRGNPVPYGYGFGGGGIVGLLVFLLVVFLILRLLGFA